MNNYEPESTSIVENNLSHEQLQLLQAIVNADNAAWLDAGHHGPPSTISETEQRGYQQGHHADEMDVDDGHRFESAADIHGEGNNVQ
ncbi:unnamed protein product [Oikopleura dioica]|uniref:Uncharacterized protein n=1 Tax=Oikopleura dioica TaxID=34765 RepID=E4XIK1_OIKDI|nr:unnamed protein product [Oikopleura dioica]